MATEDPQPVSNASPTPPLNAECPVILGLWPLAGVTTVGVTQADARATIAAAIDAGITTFDTAFSYGYDGESDRLLGEFVSVKRDRYRIIGKVGQRWSHDNQRIVDGSFATLQRDAEESLRRLCIDQFDVLMLHAPDPQTPLEASAAALAGLRERGLCQSIGICNASRRERRQFALVAGCQAIQCPLNLFQRTTLDDVIPDASAAGCQVHVYWTLMKGLLAGKITRDHVFPPGDSRRGYAIFQGQARRRAHDVVDQLVEFGAGNGKTAAELAIGWVLSQPGVTAALVGARRPEQIRATASARALTNEQVERIDQIVAGTT